MKSYLKQMNEKKYIGDCPLCGRKMFDGSSINEHHLIPRSFKGKDKINIHKACHQKIHTIFTEKELQLKFNTIGEIKKNIEIKKFINWIKKKDPEYYESSKTSNLLKDKRKAKKLRKR